MLVGYIFNLLFSGVLIVTGWVQIRYRQKFKEWSVRREQANIDTFPKVPVLTQWLSIRKRVFNKFEATISVIGGSIFIAIGLLQIIVYTILYFRNS